MVSISVNDFALRHTESSPYSHFDGTWEELLDLVKKNFKNAKKGYREDVLIVEVPSDGFFTSIVELKEGMQLVSSFEKRQEHEEPVLVTRAKGIKSEAKIVEIILYGHSALLEDNSNSSDDDFEIISINAQPYLNVPMHPTTMMRNELELSGGTKANYSKEEYIESIKFWSKHTTVI